MDPKDNASMGPLRLNGMRLFDAHSWFTSSYWNDSDSNCVIRKDERYGSDGVDIFLGVVDIEQIHDIQQENWEWSLRLTLTILGVAGKEGRKLMHLGTGTAIYRQKKEGGVMEGEKVCSDFDDQMEIVIDLFLL